MAAVCLHHLLTVEDAKVVVVASSRQQATHLFEYAERFARKLGDPHVVHRHLVLRWCPDPDTPKVWTRSLEVWASDHRKLHGHTYSLCVIDELQMHPDQGVYIAMASGLHKRDGAKLVVISTAGQGADSPLGKLRGRALGLPSIKRRGAVTDARGSSLRFLEWACAEDDDVEDPRVVKRANPASWVSLDDLRAARETLPDLAYRRFVANQWTERAGHWLPPGAWQECVGQPRFEDVERIVVGVDIGGEVSSSAVCWMNERLHVACWIGHGDEAVLEVKDLIGELAERYTIVEVAFDPWRAGQLAQELAERRIPTSGFPQTDSRMVPASKRLYDAIRQRRIVLPDDDELREHAANTIAKHSRRGWRIDKPDLRTPNDAIVAICMALDRLENQPKPMRFIGWL